MTSNSQTPILSVVVPAYNEAATIATALKFLRSELDQLHVAYEVLLVSDGNTDGTQAIARSVQFPELSVLHYDENRGKGYAIRHGFSRAVGEIVTFIDADLDLDASGIGVLMRQLTDSRVDAVIGSKVHPESHVVYPRFRRMQSAVFRHIVRALFDLDVADTQTGLKVFRREVLDHCLPLVESSGFAFDLELLVLANDAGFVVSEGPVYLDYQFSSTTGVASVVSVLEDIAALAIRRRRARRVHTWVPPRRVAI